MAKPFRRLALGTFLGFVLGAAEASAQSMNPALGRLVLDSRCQHGGTVDAPTNYGQFQDGEAIRQDLIRTTGRDTCAPDNVAFKRLMNQWAAVIAPTAMHTARTTGIGGFEFALETAITKIDRGADYWQRGTQGPRDPSTNQASIRNRSPASVLSVHSVKVRKGFGFGLEMGTQVGFIPSTTILTGGADVRMSLLEGFRTGVGGYLPDVAVGSGVRTITGTPEFQMTTVGVDAQISKPFTIAGSSTLTPWIGYQYLWIFADSGLVDTTPATDALGYCGYGGQNVPGNQDPNKDLADGQPVCIGGSPLDFNNNVVFNQARLQRQRMMVGLSYRVEVISFGVQFITDILDPSDAQAGDSTMSVVEVPTTNRSDDRARVVNRTDAEVLEGVPRQWSLVFEIGTHF